MSVEPIDPDPSCASGTGSAKHESAAWKLKQIHFPHRRDIALAGVVGPASRQALPTGFPNLDDCLPGAGWPLGALTEILTVDNEPGCLWLALPALTELSRRQQWIAMISPPCIPYAPALAGYGVDIGKILLIHPRAGKDALWAAEEALRSHTCSSVFFWLSELDNKTLRRLQLAAEQGGTLGFCFRSRRHCGQRTTAALRIMAKPNEHGAVLDILKARGGRPHLGLTVRFAQIGYE
jgi:hypothetical protein